MSDFPLYVSLIPCYIWPYIHFKSLQYFPLNIFSPPSPIWRINMVTLPNLLKKKENIWESFRLKMAAIIAQISLAARERKVRNVIWNISFRVFEKYCCWIFGILETYYWWIFFISLWQRRALEEPPVDINRSVYKLPPWVTCNLYWLWVNTRLWAGGVSKLLHSLWHLMMQRRRCKNMI